MVEPSSVGGKRFAASLSAAASTSSGVDDPSTAAASAAAATATTVTATTGTTASHHHHSTRGGGGGGRKRSRESSPVPPADAHLAPAVASAATACSNIGYHGLASLFTQASPSDTNSSANFLHLLRKENVQQAALKAATDTSPPWIHWNRNDMSTPTLRATGPHRLGLGQTPGSLRGYRMARASVGCSQGSYYYECWMQPGPTTQDILNHLRSSNARLGPGLQRHLQAALDYEKKQKQEQEEQRIIKKQQSSSSVGDGSMLKSTDNSEEDNGNNSKNSKKKKSGVDKSSSKEEPPPTPVGGHIRVGWSMRTGDLNAPVGYDQWSFGIRDTGGSIIHQSQRQDHWGGLGFAPGARDGSTPGDVVGCAITLDPVDPANKNHIRFFKNGECMGDFVITKGKRQGGEAFTGVQSGTYYPACSSYMGGAIRANFGPKFIYNPRKLPAGMKFLPMSELCPAPLDYDAAMLQLANCVKLFQRKPEHVQALQEAVKVEAHILAEAHDNYMKQHYEDVRQARLERGLTVQDLPEAPITVAAAAAAAPVGSKNS